MRLEARKCADDFDCFYPPDNFCGRGQCTDQMVATDLTIHDAVSMYLLMSQWENVVWPHRFVGHL